MTERKIFYTGDLVEGDDSRMCLFCKRGTVKAAHQCRTCGKDMHPWYESQGEPGMHWRCDDEHCGTSLFVLSDEDGNPLAVCDNEECGHEFMDEAEVKEYSAHTNVYGEETESGYGEVLTSGWVSPDWTLWDVYESHEDVAPDVMDEDDLEDMTPVDWLAQQITSRLGAVEMWDGGDSFYAADATTHPYEGKSIRLAAHPEGFTKEEMTEAARKMEATR